MLQLFDPLTGHLKQKIARFTVFPSSHYVTGRQKVLSAIDQIKVELAAAEGVLRRPDEADRGAAHRAAHALRPRDDVRDRLLQGHRELLALPVGPRRGRAAADAHRLPADERADVHRRVARDHPAGGRHVQGRSRAQGESRQLRIPAAVRARQPAAALRRVRAPDAADDLRVGHAGGSTSSTHAGQVVEQLVRPTGLVDPMLVDPPGADAGRRPAVGDPPARRAATSACW